MCDGSGAGDAAPVRSLLLSAFAGCAEADLVDALRANGDVVLALVAAQASAGVLGYVAFARLSVATKGAIVPGAALAPLAVAADVQRRGIGSALVRDGLQLLAACGEQLVFVLGDPAYYTRFGFDVASASSFVSPYAGSHFMVRRLTQAAPTDGTICYPSAFADLG
jgi:putative acetyltransferase